MSTTVANPKSLQKRQKQIARWEKKLNYKGKNFYLIYIIFIITLIYATDEIASQINTLMKTEIANNLMASFGQSSVGMLNLASSLAIPFQVLGLFYRPLADRFGRKTFLVINTFGMSIALISIFLSNNLIMYLLGACMIQFFVPHDMHVVYIMETSPPKHRARIYSSIKFVANMSVMLVPLLRRWLMTQASEWRAVYFIPALIGLVVSFIALLLAREPEVFVQSKLRQLRMTDEERAEEKRKKDAENAQGGLFTALKFALKHKQLRWLFITATFLNLGFIFSIDYQVIMSYGYAESLFGNFSESAMNAVSTGPVSTALFLFPVGCAVSQVIMGFISDGIGRKAAAITTATNCLASFILFWVGSRYNWNPLLVGFLCGASVGSFYSVNDVIIMMVGESAPTNLRSSAMSAEFIIVALGYGISMGAGFLSGILLGSEYIGTVAMILLVPGFVAGLGMLIKKTHDTKNINLDTVTGTEGD